jgi:hypothetical protein
MLESVPPIVCYPTDRAPCPVAFLMCSALVFSSSRVRICSPRNKGGKSHGSGVGSVAPITPEANDLRAATQCPLRMTTNIKERRSRPRDTISAEAPRDHLISMIIGTYREMPGLRLHVAEAARLFGLRTTTCRVVLDALVDDGTLRCTDEGLYVSG